MKSDPRILASAAEGSIQLPDGLGEPAPIAPHPEGLAVWEPLGQSVELALRPWRLGAVQEVVSEAVRRTAVVH